MKPEFQYATLDPSKLLAFQECVDDYGVGDPADPWANNCLARNAVAYSNGLMARNESSVDLRFDPDELSLSSRLANAAAQTMGKYWPGLYSANDTRTFPYFVASNMLFPCAFPTPELIRMIFGGTIYEDAQISIEPLDERGEWWDQIQKCAADCEEDDPDFDIQDEVITPWRSVIKWFGEQSELHGSCFVRIWSHRRSGLRGGCVFPMLVVGLTAKGSLAGISTFVVNG